MLRLAGMPVAVMVLISTREYDSSVSQNVRSSRRSTRSIPHITKYWVRVAIRVYSSPDYILYSSWRSRWLPQWPGWSDHRDHLCARSDRYSESVPVSDLQADTWARHNTLMTVIKLAVIDRGSVILLCSMPKYLGYPDINKHRILRTYIWLTARECENKLSTILKDFDQFEKPRDRF